MSRKRKQKKYSVEDIRRKHARAYEPWLPEEDETLRLFADHPIRELADMLKRRPSAIKNRLRKLAEQEVAPSGTAGTDPPNGDSTLNARLPGAESTPTEPISLPAKRPWTPEDDEKLRRFANVPVPALVEILKRPADSLEVRLYDLGLYRRGEAPRGLARPSHFKARRRRWLIRVGAFSMAGLLIGFVGGYLVGRSQVPPARSLGRRPPSDRSAEAIVVPQDACMSVATWNIRGYPERREEDAVWFTKQLRQLGADVLCIQEVANDERLAALLEDNEFYSESVFTDSEDGQDNAILATPDIALEGLDVPEGFQHPPQVAVVAHRGFDATVVTLHLTWEPASRRAEEMRLLQPLVTDLLQVDPDLMLVGDFNLRPESVHSLAGQLGLVVLMGSNQTTVGTLHSGSSYDYFLISPDLATEEAQGATVVVFDDAELDVARRVSDHMPVLAMFACDDHFRDRPSDDGLSE